MPRPRKTAANLPPYVYIRRGWYVLRGYLGQGRLGKDVKLCPADAPLSEVWARYESQTTRGAIRKTVAWLIGEYLKSPQHASKSPKTRAEYEKAGEHFKNYPLRSGGLFGEVDAERVTPGVVRKYLDNRANAPVAANRAVAFLSVCFSWAVERDILRANPCKDVRRNSEKARVRYVTDAEYSAIHALAGELGWKHVQVAMEAGLVVGQGGDQPFAVAVPALRHAERESGEHQRVEPVRVHLQELDLPVQADAAEHRGDQAIGPAVADVVHADVELELLLAPEYVGVAARHVVLLQDERAQAVGGEVGRGRQAAQP